MTQSVNFQYFLNLKATWDILQMEYFYITDGSFSKTDSIGSYNKIPSNKGIAVIDSHIYGFIF